MMRPITCLSLMVALGAGLYLYQVKHRAQLLDQDINRTVKLADAARERIGLLKAEWALLEDPQRLQDLATHHLQLQPLAPSQFVRLEDLAARLPAVVVPAAPAEPLVAAAAPAAEPAMAARVAPVLPAMSLPATSVADVAEPAKPAPAPVHPAPPRPARPTMVASLAKPAHPLFAPVVRAYEPSSLGVHAPTIQTASASAPAAPPPVPFVGSALGMARTGIAPPVPVPQAGGLAGGGSLGYPGAR